MSEETCGCDGFERLQGAAAHAYTVRFLERTGADAEHRVAYYRCRVCSRDWKQSGEPGQRRATLIRLDREESV